MTSSIGHGIKAAVACLQQLPTWSVVLFTIVLGWYLWPKPRLDGLPVVIPDKGPEGVYNTLTRTYEQPFVLKTKRPIVILPGSLVDDVKNLPETVASLHSEVYIDHSMAVTKVGGGTYGQELLPTVRIDLTRHTNGAIPALLDELRFSMEKEMGEVGTAGWTELRIHPRITNLAAFMLSRIFIGRPVSRRPEWIASSIGYSIDLMKSRHVLNLFPYWARIVVGPLLPPVRRMKFHLNNGKKVIQPIVEALVRQKLAAESADPKEWAHLEKRTMQQIIADGENDEFEDEMGTFCAWLLKYQVNSKDATPDEIATSLALNQLALSWVSLHSVSFAVTRAIQDMITRPQYIQPLLDEIEEVLQQDSDEVDGQGRRVMNRNSYVKLRKLDSFLKESMRLTPNKMVNMARILKADVTLSTGQVLPAGTRVGIPVYHVHTSPSTPKTYVSGAGAAGPGDAPADEFDGFRFSRLRDLPGNENKYQFIAISSDYLAWGAGTHSCPGRFFSSTCIKVLLVELLRFWEFRMVGDVDGKGGPPVGHRLNDFTLITDTTVPLEVRRRQGAH